MNQFIPFHQSVFIAYTDANKKQECCRMYPHDEESYYECMDDMMENYDFWACLDRREIDKELSPFDRFQVDRYGSILPPVNAPAEEIFENGVHEISRNAEWSDAIVEQRMDDHWNY